MTIPPIVLGDINSVLQLPPSDIRAPGDWLQEDSDLLAHFIQVDRQIAKSKWMQADLTVSGEGKNSVLRGCPTLEEFVFAAVYFRQIIAKKDSLLNKAADRFCRHIDCDYRTAWIRHEQDALKAVLHSECAMLPGYTPRELFNAFIYGAGLMHLLPEPANSTRRKFLSLYDNEPPAMLLHALHGGLALVFNHVTTAAALVHRELSHWLPRYSLPAPDVRWHYLMFRPNKPQTGPISLSGPQARRNRRIWPLRSPSRLARFNYRRPAKSRTWLFSTVLGCRQW